MKKLTQNEEEIAALTKANLVMDSDLKDLSKKASAADAKVSDMTQKLKEAKAKVEQLEESSFILVSFHHATEKKYVKTCLRTRKKRKMDWNSALPCSSSR